MKRQQYMLNSKLFEAWNQKWLTLHGGKFFMIFVASCLFVAVVFCFVFENQLLKENLKRILSESKTIWIQIRSNILPGPDLICVQIVCRVYQQTTLVGKELKAHRTGFLLSTDNLYKQFRPRSIRPTYLGSKLFGTLIIFLSF